MCDMLSSRAVRAVRVARGARGEGWSCRHAWWERLSTCGKAVHNKYLEGDGEGGGGALQGQWLSAIPSNLSNVVSCCISAAAAAAPTCRAVHAVRWARSRGVTSTAWPLHAAVRLWARSRWARLVRWARWDSRLWGASISVWITA